jgi:bla regulator protein BlaR1
MNQLNALVTSAIELGGEGLRLAIFTGFYAGLFAGVVLLANLLLRKLLTAAQKGLLWALVLVRLLMPWGPASVLSLQNLFIPAEADSAAIEAANWSSALMDAPADPPRGYAASLPATAIE